IRDLIVTGVQTCALPISGEGGRTERRPRLHGQHRVPQQRQDPVEQEDGERGREERPDEQRAPRPPRTDRALPVSGPAAGSPSARPRPAPPPPACAPARPPGTRSRTPP